MLTVVCGIALLVTFAVHSRKLRGRKIITLIYYQGFLYSKAIITSQSRCRCRGLSILCLSRNFRRMSLRQEMEKVKEKEVRF